jgi:hypothetical protein
MSLRATHLLMMIVSAVVTIGAIAACTAHRRRSSVARWYYVAGAAAWGISVALKFILAGALFYALERRYGEHLPLPLDMAASGLLTSVTECGLVALWVRRSRVARATEAEAVAFGLGFGLFEDAAAALLVLVTTGFALVAGVLDDTLPLHAPITFLHERVIVVPIHALCCVLVVDAVQRRRARSFVAAFVLKGAVDAIPLEGALREWIVQSAYLSLGMFASVVLLLRFRRGLLGSSVSSVVEVQQRADP